ncbi:hypothetical protein P2H44_16655 [Albimonas sp. CAU 1670]|uniref:hypothetical protein n=1 Tax=Albimonas sp. CAU 1670 TaxID=3032599 RepID=UPI0023DA7C76|nr:hypothetical protein [Albimonas sp. CAU 1670]MDF2234195.1 hypothetical protein [Albimonas sp. CAU 1670]
MARREIDVDGAGPQAVRTGPQADPHASPGAAGDGAGRAAARYLDAWDANQSEVSRVGPQVLPGFPPGGFGR